MSAHTPGPWLGRPDHDPILIQGANDVGLSIAFACGGGSPRREEFMANARLIAAAPELLSIAERWAALDGGAWHVQRHASEKAELLADTAAAIAKATGEQP